MKKTKDIIIHPGIDIYFQNSLWPPDEYPETDESIVSDLIRKYNIDQGKFGDVLFLFIAFRAEIILSVIEHERIKHAKELRYVIKSVKILIESTSRPSIIESLQTAYVELNTELDSVGLGLRNFLHSGEYERGLDDLKNLGGRPTEMDSSVIKSCIPLAQFFWQFEIIQGKKGKPSKEIIYQFIHDIIIQAGYPWNSKDVSIVQKNISNIKTLLKNSLSEVDHLKE